MPSYAVELTTRYDGLVIASFPDLPGVTALGVDDEDARAEARRALEEALTAMGRKAWCHPRRGRGAVQRSRCGCWRGRFRPERSAALGEPADGEISDERERPKQEERGADGADADQQRIPSRRPGETGAHAEQLGVGFIESVAGHCPGPDVKAW